MIVEKRQWLRLYADIVNDDKLGLLAFQDRWHFVALLALKASGLLDADCDAELKRRRIACKLGITELELDELGRRLAEVDLVDRQTLQPSAWDKRQFENDSSTERTRLWRERKTLQCDASDGHRDVTVTPPDTESYTSRSKESALRAEVGATRTDPPQAQAQVATKPITNGQSNPIGNGDSSAQAATDAGGGITDDAQAARCPVQRIVALYHETLPMCPRIEKLTRTRESYIRARWREDLPSLDAFRNYFLDVSKSPFLTGHASGSRDRPPFVADLEWLTRPANFAKVAEGRYHRG